MSARAKSLSSRARRRFHRWRDSFPDTDLFDRRLARLRLRSEDLLAFLDDAGTLDMRDPAAPWADLLETAYRTGHRGSVASAPPGPPSADHALLTPLGPLIGWALRRFEAGLEALRAPRLSSAAVESLSAGLCPWLTRVLGQTLAVELRVAGLEQRLSGCDEKERFQSFCKTFEDPATAARLLDRYPVLARQAAEFADQWCSASLELCRRLAAAREGILRRFARGEDPGELVAVEACGDPHRGGRRVHRLKYASGLEVYYKPRSLAAEAAFQDLLGWIEGRGFGLDGVTPVFRRLRVWDRGSHGFMEGVTPAPCISRTDLGRFYWRLGALLGLLYVLEATDFHFENLVAAGEHPVPVDMETLFHPRVDGRALGESVPGAGSTDLMRVGLLPQPDPWRRGRLDLSGIGAREGQEAPEPVLVAEGQGTDALRYVRRTAVIGAVPSRPRVSGAEAAGVDPYEFRSDLHSGFEELLRCLISHRREMADDDGPLAAFRDAEVRVVVRPSETYALLLAESFHPRLLGDGLDRDRHFDLLWGAAAERPFLEELVATEIRALQRGDVPIFVTRPGSRDLWLDGDDHRAAVLPESGLERVGRRLRALDHAEVDRLSWAVEQSFISSRADGERDTAGRERGEAVPAERRQLLAAAAGIGERLAALAFTDGGSASWLTPQLGAGKWYLGPAGADLYHGLPGIALFLAHLGHETGKAGFTDLARQALETLRYRLERSSHLTAGAFDGFGGVIYTFAHLADLWRAPRWLDEAEALLGRLPEALQKDQAFDVVGGAAGALLCLLAFRRLRPVDRALDLAIRCGEILVAEARPQACGGLAWEAPATGSRTLTGLAHGAAGMAWALLELATATGDGSFAETARGALRWERALYDPRRRNWPDQRSPDAARFKCAWCYGASGIGLARLRCRDHLDDPEVDAEVGAAVATTLGHGFGGGHGLCHGDLGNLDLLLEAALASSDGELQARIDREAGAVLADGERYGWCGDRPGNPEALGLMNGLAGIGYGLLRLASPRRAPSVLTLSLPRQDSRTCVRRFPWRDATSQITDPRRKR